MKLLAVGAVGVDQGSDTLFSDFESGGDMWTGTGKRERRKSVAFSAPFAAVPTVQVAISMIDMDHCHNHRIDLSAAAITQTGFEIVFRTWGDTRVARVRVNWLAIGPVASDDNWIVG